MTEKITAPKVHGILEEHLQLHKEKLNPMLYNHREILFGEKGDNGLCSVIKDHNKRIKDLEDLKSELSKVKWAVIIAIAAQIALKYLPL